MTESYSKLRARMQAAGLWPQGWIARGAWYSLSCAIGLFALEMLLKLLAPAWGDSIGGWVKFLVFDAALLFSILAFRWVKRKALWRLRNRLIVTYVFIGVIPAVLLVAMALITLYGFAGQFAIFVVTSDINSQLHRMEAVNAAVGNELVAHLERGDNAAVESLAGLRKRDVAWRRRRMCAWYGDKFLPLGDESKEPPFSLPTFANVDGVADITRDSDGLHLRVATLLPVGSKTLTIVSSEPFDKELVGKIAADMGEITIFVSDQPQNDQPQGNKSGAQKAAAQAGASTNPASSHGIQINEGGGASVHLRQAFAVGTVPAAVGNTDREVTFPAPLPVLDWKTGVRARVGALVQVRTRPSVLYAHLFAALGDFVRGVEYILLGIFIFFAVIELVALIIGTRMTRTMTASVAQLYDATKHVDRGDFKIGRAHV